MQIYGKDCQYIQRNQPEGEFPAFCVTIQGQTYTDKKEAGKALLDICTSISTPDTAMEIGSYRGFRLELSFKTFSKSYYLELVQEGRYGIHLGKDMIGNLTHMEQELQSLFKSFEKVKTHYTDTMRQMENAKAEVKAPFPQEQELEQKKARFQKLDAELDLTHPEIVVMDDPEEDLEKAEKVQVGQER